MKIIITGGAGFIGSHLVDSLLRDNHNITILDNLSTGRLENLSHVSDKIRFIDCDLSQRGKWDQCDDCDVIFISLL